MRNAVRETLTRLLRERGQSLVLVDVGARNGPRHMEDMAPQVDVFAFEPNPEEYRKLVEGRTDAIQCGIPLPPYKSITYFPYALFNANGPSEFFVTPGPGACGLLEPEIEGLREIIWKGRRYEKNFGDDIFANHRTISVETRRLDDLARERSLPTPDLLKVDVEGAEYEVLEGASGILSDVGVIFVEVCFTPFRKNQKLFSHVDVMLRDFGFQLVNYRIEQSQVGYKALPGALHPVPRGYADPFGQPLSGDAVYVNKGVTDPDRVLKQAIVLLEEGFVDEGLFLLKTKCRLDAATNAVLLDPRQHSNLADAMYGRGFDLVHRVLQKASVIKQKFFA